MRVLTGNVHMQLPYMKHLDVLLRDCMRSDSVGSVVAILLSANLKGSDAAEFDDFVPVFHKVLSREMACFLGER